MLRCTMLNNLHYAYKTLTFMSVKCEMLVFSKLFTTACSYVFLIYIFECVCIRRREKCAKKRRLFDVEKNKKQKNSTYLTTPRPDRQSKVPISSASVSLDLPTPENFDYHMVGWRQSLHIIN